MKKAYFATKVGTCVGTITSSVLFQIRNFSSSTAYYYSSDFWKNVLKVATLFFSLILLNNY